MAMVVQHNMTAANANRQLGITTGAQAKSTEKLSSGFKINRAADDAAGLKISEKMRSQVRGLQRASTNAQDGVSAIQTAEGALNEAHSILQRMNELAVQGANDTNESIDRDAINQELDALTTELDRIAETTQFNKQNLLDGSFVGKNLQVGANSDQKIAITIGAMNASAIGITTTTTVPAKGDRFETTAAVSNKSSATSAGIRGSVEKVGEKMASTALANLTGKAKGVTITVMGNKYTLSTTTNSAKGVYTSGDVKTKAGKLYANENIKQTQKASEAITFTGAKVDSYEVANATIDKVQEAINKVSGQRSALGAIQNRLEHTIANLDNVAENTDAAESRIRDTDMAKEMVTFSKNNILAQAGQSMLAQANQSTQGVLSLLQ